MAICTDRSGAETKEVVRKMGLTFKVAQDPRGESGCRRLLDIKLLPCLALLDRQGRVVQIFNDFYLSEIEAALKDINSR